MAKNWIIVSIENGEIKNRKAVATFFKSLKNGRTIIESKDYDKRTNPQNRYLHGVLIPEFRRALNEVGYDEVKTDLQAKEIIKKMFLTRQIINRETGEVLEYIQPTSELTKEETNILIDEVIKFTAENMNHQIAYPNEQIQMEY